MGKAVDLKSRVNQYFQKGATLEYGKEQMVALAKDLDHIITDNELEALVLEASLIKQHKPKYNIRLKDDKYYKFIVIDYTTSFPKIFSTRQIEKKSKNKKYFGPFTDGLAVNETLEILRTTFRYRNCSREIPENQAEAKRKNKRPCLDFYIKRCTAPCVGLIDKKQYQEQIKNAEEFLKGKSEDLEKKLKIEMQTAAQLMDFERATLLRDQVKSLAKTREKQKVLSVKGENQDIIAINQGIVLMLIIRDGKLLNKEKFELENIDKDQSKTLTSFLEQYYIRENSFPKEIIIPFKIDSTLIQKFFQDKNNSDLQITIPEKGKKLSLLKLAQTNLEEFQKQEVKTKKLARENQLQQLLKTKSPINRIEAYDISNIQGKFATGSMVVLKNNQPQKSEYRKFKIIREGEPDDVAMMSEMVLRRLNHSQFARIKKDKWEDPDLVLLDGGKGQLNAVNKIFESQKVTWPIAAIAKKEEELYLPNRKNPIALKKYPEIMKCFQLIRDEAHRFAITYHRKLRNKNSLR